MKKLERLFSLFLLCATCGPMHKATAQDWVHTGTNLGNAKHPHCGGGLQAHWRRSADAGAQSRLRRDPLQRSGQRRHLRPGFKEHGAAGHARLAAGDQSAAVVRGSGQARPWWPSAHSPSTSGRLAVYGWLFDTSNTASPQVLGKQYNEAASEDMARTIAHRFADEIIARLGGGINGIAETKIYFVSTRTGTKEIWVMDYDGQNQHAITHLGTISLSPRISPDNSRLAFASLGTRRMGDPHVSHSTWAAW